MSVVTDVKGSVLTAVLGSVSSCWAISRCRPGAMAYGASVTGTGPGEGSAGLHGPLFT